MKSILLVKKLLGLVGMKSGLVNASFSLPEWQAVKMIFFAPCKQINARLFCHPILFDCLTSVTQFPLQSYEYNPLTGLTLKDFSL